MSGYNKLTEKGKKLALKQNVIAIAFVIFCSISTYFIWGLYFASSVLAGGAVYIIPHCVFAYNAFKYAGAQASEKVVDSFYRGEKLKIVLTAILFTLALKFLAIEPVAFFSSFCLVMVLPLLTPIFIKF